MSLTRALADIGLDRDTQKSLVDGREELRGLVVGQRDLDRRLSLLLSLAGGLDEKDGSLCGGHLCQRSKNVLWSSPHTRGVTVPCRRSIGVEKSECVLKLKARSL
jgi:hypothetical protein